MFDILKTRFTIQWFKAAGMRALHTFLQAGLGCLGVGSIITEADWTEVLGVAITAGIISLVKSFIANVPELSEYDGVSSEVVAICEDGKDIPELIVPEAEEADATE